MTITEAVQNPQLLLRKAGGRLRRRFARIPEEAVVSEMGGGVRFEHRRLPFLNEEDIRAMMTNSYDITACDCFRRHLSPGQIVLDAGANIGYMSAVAASCAGTGGEVHAFEPLAECFAQLQNLPRLNPGFRFFLNNAALGEQKGTLKIGFDPEGDMRNASLVPGKQAPVTRDVPVWRLDDYIAENIAAPERIGIIKVDVEGFELAVLRGLEGFFSGSRFRPPIICEIKPWEVRNLGRTMQDFESYMKQHGYGSYEVSRESKAVELTEMQDMDTVLFRKS